ncbi:MAG: hypothetical protein PHZ19_07795 [Candidatus Thermoplasmatota archaeon]|nr:hypothetical protein [Candidatus Thermoplasmatota archaeon]
MTAISLATLRSRLRVYLNDSNKKLWPNDDELDLFLNHALIKFTHDVPIPTHQVYTVATDQQGDAHTYLLPEDFVADRFVRGGFQGAGDTETVSRLNMAPGVWAINDEPVGYVPDYPDKGYLYLPRAPYSDTFSLFYGAYHDDWLTEEDDAIDLSRNRWGEEAIYAYAAFLAFNPSSARRAQLEQWARRGDQNVGNPLEEEASRWEALYWSLISNHAQAPAVWEFVRMKQ